VCKGTDGRQKLRVRRGLGTSDKEEAQRLVDDLNEILDDRAMWNLTSRQAAEVKYDSRIVAAFYDHMRPEQHDPWAARDAAIPLPGGQHAGDGYARVLFVGTTGSGKTTIVRQLLGTDPVRERFPSISAAKTTTCDIEVVLDEGSFRAVVTFIPRDRARQYIAECVLNAVVSKLNGASERDVVRRFTEHSEQRFRLSYILGSPMLLRPPAKRDLEDEDADEVEQDASEESEITETERAELLRTLEGYLRVIEELADRARPMLERTAAELGITLSEASGQERDALQELVEDQIVDTEEFHELVDDILDAVEARFELLTEGELTRGRDTWPLKWVHSTDDREQFLRAVNRFSSNYAPNFGRLLTPLVEGLRVAGPFRPAWHDNGAKLALMDGQGIGHTADSHSSISTSITKRFQLADAIVLVDNAAQPLQAGACVVLETLVASGHESKLIVAFTHFDEVSGDNLASTAAKKDHVFASFDNAVHAIGKKFGREAEAALKELIPDRVVFLANIQRPLKKSAKLTLSELARLLENIHASITPPKPTEYKPVYDVANLVLAIQKATQEFHDRWKGVLGMGSRPGVAAEHWSRVKALTRRLGTLGEDEYDTLKPVADLIRLLQGQISVFLSAPLTWQRGTPPEDSGARVTAIDPIRKEVFARLHELSRRRVMEARLAEWYEAYMHRGAGSTRVRARDMVTLYEGAAPIPNEMPGSDANQFLFELRELIAESIITGGGELRGWFRQDSAEGATEGV